MRFPLLPPRFPAPHAALRGVGVALLACALGACGPATPFVPPGTGADPRGTALGDDTEFIDGADVPADPPEQPFGCADIYADDLLPAFSITLSEETLAALRADFSNPGACGSADPKVYYPVTTFSYGDEVISNASIRLRGNECFSWVPPKMQFVVSFNETDPDGRFHGLRKVNFDAPWYDGSLLHERLAASFLRDAGLPGICANNSTLTLNGTYYGAYANTEHMDHEFLERVFGADDAGDDAGADTSVATDGAAGTLYKYGWYPAANDDAADATRLNAFWASTDPAVLSTLGDLDQWLAEWAGEAVMPDGDGYQCCNHNWMLYDHPTRGFLFVPYDLDYTFDGGDLYSPISPTADPTLATWGTPQHFNAFMTDPTERAAYVNAVAEMRTHYDVDLLLDRVDRWSAQIEDAVTADPNRTFTLEDHERAVGLLQGFIPRRAAALDAWLAASQ